MFLAQHRKIVFPLQLRTKNPSGSNLEPALDISVICLFARKDKLLPCDCVDFRNCVQKATAEAILWKVELATM
jgi:hypothetical protein